MKQVERFARANPGVLLRVTDFPHASAGAVSQAFSRLESSGLLERVARGVYYAPKQTLLGRSQPAAAAVVRKVLSGHTRPHGVSAANLLGLSTQVAAKPELVVYGQSNVEESLVRTTRRKGKRSSGGQLAPAHAAVLEVLRDGGRFSELSEKETLNRVRDALAARRVHETSETLNKKQDSSRPHRLATLASLGKTQTFSTQDDGVWVNDSKNLRGLVKATMNEPPRVRAMLGALLEDLKLPKRLWQPLRESLNPLSRFEFGPFRELENAKDWQAK
jgi:hypothetical protein